MKLATPLLAASFALTLLLGCAAENESLESRETLELTLDNIFRSAGGAGRAALSRDGRFVAVERTVSGQRGIEILAADGSSPLPLPKTLPANPEQGARSPAWSPVGDTLAWVSSDGIATLSNDGAEQVLLATGLGGVRRPTWSPDGSHIAFFSSTSGTQDLWLVPADGSSAPRQLTSGAAEVDDTRFRPSWSPDGRFLAYISNAADWWHDDVWIVEVVSGKTAKVSNGLMASSTPIWSPDGQSLVLMGTAKDEYWYQDLAYLYRLDLTVETDGDELPQLRSEAPIEMQVYATDFIMRFDPFWGRDGETVYFPYHERGAFDLWAVPASGGVATRVTHLGGAWSALEATADGRYAVFVRDAPTEGREAWLLDTEAATTRQLTNAAPRLASVQKPREVSFRSFDGLYMQGFLYLPPGLPKDDEAPASLRCPALVQVHGGGTNSYYQGTNLVEQYLASRGFAVLAINYRGGSGFGRAFQDLAIEDWLGDQSKDPGSAADWLRQQTWSNGKVGIYGGSYGGMQSMSAITRTPDKFDAAVPMRGIYSEAKTLESADRLGRIFTVTGHGGTPEERPDTYATSETLDRMEAITAPVLVMHGERDVRAPFSNYELAVERLTELGKEFEAKSYPEGHAFRDPANSIDMYSRLEDFFSKHLGRCSEASGAP
ncbi:MAG: prolyl oligopeptidase family serine peptidase [Acidobacteriota bacterium]